jgi:hypothetical protein
MLASTTPDTQSLRVGVSTSEAPRSETCPTCLLAADTKPTVLLRVGVHERRVATWEHQDALGEKRTRTVYAERRSSSTPYLRYLKRTWAKRAHRAWERLERRTLRDFRVGAGNRAWHKAVEQAQRPYPGTAAWLLSCSASEGGHGRWVRYGGGSYYPGYEHTDGVGGHLQFRPSTFKGFYRRAVEDVESRGFIVPNLGTWLDAWQSALGQALAGAWGVTHGMRSHWAGAGCR